MKKILLASTAVACLALAFVSAGCATTELGDLANSFLFGQQNTSVATAEKEDTNETAEEAFKNTVLLTEADFKYELTRDGNDIRLTEYLGKETRIRIPEKIEGFPVVELSVSKVGFSYLCFEKSKLPLKTQKRLRGLGYTGSFAGTRPARTQE